MGDKSLKEKRKQKWYHGGLAAAGAACVTHPFDLLKVQMQTQQGKGSSILEVIGVVIKNQGVLGLYNGISAALARQITYSTTRFGIYETVKTHIGPKHGEPVPFYKSMALAGISGLAGGFVGNPADVVNVRMQNDIKLPPDKRRNYRHIFHGLHSITQKEGVSQLWAGATMNCLRATLMTIGQISVYYQVKHLLLQTSYFVDDVVTHITSAIVAGVVATTLTQPADVLKTRAMTSKKGEFKGLTSLFLKTAKEGPLAFFKGYIPAFIRLGPHTILTFLFLEQLTTHFGDVIQDES